MIIGHPHIQVHVCPIHMETNHGCNQQGRSCLNFSLTPGVIINFQRIVDTGYSLEFFNDEMDSFHIHILFYMCIISTFISLTADKRPWFDAEKQIATHARMSHYALHATCFVHSPTVVIPILYVICSCSSGPTQWYAWSLQGIRKPRLFSVHFYLSLSIGPV